MKNARVFFGFVTVFGVTGFVFGLVTFLRYSGRGMFTLPNYPAQFALVFGFLGVVLGVAFVGMSRPREYDRTPGRFHDDAARLNKMIAEAQLARSSVGRHTATDSEQSRQAP